MSRVTYTPLGSVLNGGQQRKVYNLIAHFVHNEFALNIGQTEWPTSALDDSDHEDSDAIMEDALKKRRPDYQGATVIEPTPGFYKDSVSTLDFESLYPSIMIHFNLCPSVYVKTSDLVGLLKHNTSDDEPIETRFVVESHTIDHAILTDASKEVYNEFKKDYGFVKTVQGVIPRLLQHLLKARKVAKKAMNAATDDFERSVQNGRQLALKVSCNSVYGFFGVSQKKGLLSCKPVAAVTTLKGRAFIDAAKTYVEAHYAGSKVLYGDTDSIMINWGPAISISKAYILAEEASAAITVLLRAGTVQGATKPLLDSASAAVTLANEKVYRPYLLIQKKNYAGLKYTLKNGIRDGPTSDDDFDQCIDMKGIDAVRRDRSKLVKTLSGAILDALLLKRSLDAALDVLQTTLMDVANGAAPLDWFILSKSLKGTYASENQPHVQAWKRMAARGDTDIPEVGTRMPYVIVRPKSSAKVGPLYERVEHPDYVLRAKLHYDAKYYIENAQDVVERLLGPTGLGSKVRGSFQMALATADQKAAGTMSLMAFMAKKKKVEV
jgi:DNA polymerase delta subunit 1